MSDLDLLIDLHERNARQGPGGEGETLRAVEVAGLGVRLEVGLYAGRSLEVCDIGCGTGASALVLARALDARVTAVDAAPAFIERLRERAVAAGLGGVIDARVGSMESLPFADASFDVVWSEGAIYNMGFDAGVRAWRRLLRCGGVLAFTELSWTTAARPAEIEAYWTAEYPGIRTAGENLSALEGAGYRVLGCFLLPGSCWVEHYYGPLAAGFGAFLDRHGHGEEARAIVEAEEREMRLYREFGAWYGYVFYIAGRVG